MLKIIAAWWAGLFGLWLLLVLSGFRALHGGHVGDYVTWLVVGTTAFGVAFALALR